MLDSPGPLDQGQKTFFSITPVPDDWPPELVDSYLREMNTRQMSLLLIHEAVPGHYLQMVYANRGSSLARRVFRSGLFAEGWAVYVTQVMLDPGTGTATPRCGSTIGSTTCAASPTRSSTSGSTRWG